MFVGRIFVIKYILFIVLGVLICLRVASQTEVTAADPNKAYKILNNHNKFYAGLNFGLYQFYGDIGTDEVFAGSMMKGKFPYMISPRFGWDFNERFGVRGVFGLGDIWVQSDKPGRDIYFNASVRDLQAHFNINLTNLVTPYFYNKKWYINMYIGAGWVWFRTIGRNSNDEVQYFYGYDTFGNKQPMLSTLMWSGGTTIGFKIAKHTDLNIEIQAYKPVTDYLDGVYRSLSEMDMYSSVSIGINYYFGKKEQEWKWNPMDYVIRGIYDNLAKQEKQVADLNVTVKEIKGEVVDSAKIADKDHDNVPDFKDADTNTPPGAIVNWQGRSIPVIDTNQLISLIRSLNIKTDTVIGAAPKKEEEKKSELIPAKAPSEIVGFAFLFGSAYFPFDKSTIDINSYKEIVKVAQYMLLHPQVKILVSGNCDRKGTADYNDKLAHERSAAVKKILTEDFGIAADRISEESNSNKKPLSRSVDEVNRRVDFFIIQ